MLRRKKNVTKYTRSLVNLVECPKRKQGGPLSSFDHQGLLCIISSQQFFLLDLLAPSPWSHIRIAQVTAILSSASFIPFSHPGKTHHLFFMLYAPLASISSLYIASSFSSFFQNNQSTGSPTTSLILSYYLSLLNISLQTLPLRSHYISDGFSLLGY